MGAAQEKSRQTIHSSLGYKSVERDFEDARNSAPKSPLQALFTKNVTIVHERERDISMHELIENAAMITKLLKPFIAIEKQRAKLVNKLHAVEKALDLLREKKYQMMQAAE